MCGRGLGGGLWGGGEKRKPMSQGLCWTPTSRAKELQDPAPQSGLCLLPPLNFGLRNCQQNSLLVLNKSSETNKNWRCLMVWSHLLPQEEQGKVGPLRHTHTHWEPRPAKLSVSQKVSPAKLRTELTCLKGKPYHP